MIAIEIRSGLPVVVLVLAALLLGGAVGYAHGERVAYQVVPMPGFYRTPAPDLYPGGPPCAAFGCQAPTREVHVCEWHVGALMRIGFEEADAATRTAVDHR